MNDKELLSLANKARKRAYAPYSGFLVGAALLTKSGKVYLGCNIESASYSPTNCAERTAIFSAVAQGERDFLAIAVCGGKTDSNTKRQICPPCGVCRQVMTEFCDADFKVILGKGEEYKVYTLEEIMPFGVNPLKK